MTITKKIEVTMELPDNITEEEAEDKFYQSLYDGICNNAETAIDFSYCLEE